MKVEDLKGNKIDMILISNNEDVTKSFFLPVTVVSTDSYIKVAQDINEATTKALSFVNRTGEFDFLEHDKNTYLIINGKKYGDVGDGCQSRN